MEGSSRLHFESLWDSSASIPTPAAGAQRSGAAGALAGADGASATALPPRRRRTVRPDRPRAATKLSAYARPGHPLDGRPAGTLAGWPAAVGSTGAPP